MVARSARIRGCEAIRVLAALATTAVTTAARRAPGESPGTLTVPGQHRFNRWYDERELQACGFTFAAEDPRPGPTKSLREDSAYIWKRYSEHHRRCREAGKVGTPDGCPALVWTCTGEATCGGLGDQIRGLATALYLAVLNDRVLSLRWERFGADVTAELAAGAIDWRDVPAKPRCEHVHEVDAASLDHLDLGREKPCVAITTNFPPEWLPWSDRGAAGGAFGRAVEPAYARGCAFRYIFQPSERWSQAWHSDLPIPSSNAPHIAIHFRFGDGYMSATNTSDIRASQRDDIERALRCAEAVGTDIRGQDALKSRLLIVADSQAGRAWAVDRAVKLGMDAFTTASKPVHIDQTGGPGDPGGVDELRSVLRDFVLLAESKAMVMSGVRHGPTGSYHSGFAITAAQLGLLPHSRHMAADGDSCEPFRASEEWGFKLARP